MSFRTNMVLQNMPLQGSDPDRFALPDAGFHAPAEEPAARGSLQHANSLQECPDDHRGRTPYHVSSVFVEPQLAFLP